MNMDDYDGPTVAVLVQTHATLLGASTTEVVSVHEDQADAARVLAEQIAASGSIGPGWRVLVVPAPFLARRDDGQPVQHEHESVGDREAIAAVIKRHMPETQTYGREDNCARDVLKVVGQRMRDARAQRDVDLADALGWSESDVRDVPGSWGRMCREVRRLAQVEPTELRARLVRELDPDHEANAERVSAAVDAYRAAPAGDVASALAAVRGYLAGA